MHRVGKHERFAHDPVAVSDLLDFRVEPEIRVAALERPVAERVDPLVETGADPRHLALRDPQPQRLDHLVDLPGRHAGHIRLLHHRDQRLLRASARLEEAGEVRATPQLRDRQLELAGACRPCPRPVAVAVRQPLLRGALAAGGANQLRHLDLHQLLHHPGQRLAQEVEPLLLEQIADDLLSSHPLRLGHRGDSPLVVSLAGTDEFERRGGRTTRLRPTLSYTTLRDVTLTWYRFSLRVSCRPEAVTRRSLRLAAVEKRPSLSKRIPKPGSGVFDTTESGSKKTKRVPSFPMIKMECSSGGAPSLFTLFLASGFGVSSSNSFFAEL